jgi:hypothetical protein
VTLEPPSPPRGESTPLVFEVYVGSFGGPSYGAWWDGARITYESFEARYERRRQELVTPSAAQWHRFWRTMDEISVWQWRRWYGAPERFEPREVIRDGTHWSLTLERLGRRVESSGDTAGPGAADLDESSAFVRFREAVSRLLGSRAFA